MDNAKDLLTCLDADLTLDALDDLTDRDLIRLGGLLDHWQALTARAVQRRLTPNAKPESTP